MRSDVTNCAASWENQQPAYAKTKTQINFAVTAKLISVFVFATRIVQFLFYLIPKFQASSSFLCLYRLVCVRPVLKQHCCFFHEAAQFTQLIHYSSLRFMCNLLYFCYRTPKESLSIRMVRHYASEIADNSAETRSNIFVPIIFGRRRSSSATQTEFKQRSRCLTAMEAEINMKRLEAVGDLISVFYDDEDDISSDQDDLIEELQDIGYFITPKGVNAKSMNVKARSDVKT